MTGIITDIDLPINDMKEPWKNLFLKSNKMFNVFNGSYDNSITLQAITGYVIVYCLIFKNGNWHFSTLFDDIYNYGNFEVVDDVNQQDDNITEFRFNPNDNSSVIGKFTITKKNVT